MQTYAIGDIHGHLDLLQEQHAWIAEDIARSEPAPIVHIGDLVDRGPDSCGVVEYLRQGVEAGRDWVVLKGNHDRMFMGFMADMNHVEPGLREDLGWLHPKLGGSTTLASYGVRNASDRPLAKVHAEALVAVPQTHRDFLTSRPASYRRDQSIFVHAGIRPNIPLEDQTETDLVWIRKGFLEDTRDHGALIVHGHTAIADVTLYSNRLNIDSSAAYGGPLTSVVIEGRQVFRLTAKGRVQLVPAG